MKKIDEIIEQKIVVNEVCEPNDWMSNMVVVKKS